MGHWILTYWAGVTPDTLSGFVHCPGPWLPGWPLGEEQKGGFYLGIVFF